MPKTRLGILLKDIKDVAKIAGFDLTTEDFWLKGLEQIEKEIEECKNIISVKIGGNEILNIGGIDCATLKVTKMSFFDKDRFSKDHPDEYKKYVIDKEMRVLRVKKISS